MMKRLSILCLLIIIALLTPELSRADECSMTLDNQVQNCGFEAGTFSGWSLTGFQSSPSFLGISHGVDAADAHTGTYGAYFGGFGGVLDLFQLLATSPGTSYQVSWWMAQSPATALPYVTSFSATFGSRNLLSISNVPDLPYRQYSFTVAADGKSTPLVFAAQDDTGYFSLDDVSIVAVASPEPGSLLLLVMGGATLAVGLACHNRSRIKPN